MHDQIQSSAQTVDGGNARLPEFVQLGAAPEDRPRVSVVIPTRNRRRLLARTLASVLRQADVDLEVIVVDDASEDDTETYLRSLRHDHLRVIRHEKATGPSVARNTGIETSTAPFVAFCDSDDLWAPENLASQVSAIRMQTGARWACAGVVTVDEELQIVRARHPPTGPKLLRDLLARDTVPGGGSGVVAETSLVRSLGGFDTNLSLMADWDMWIRMAQHAPMASSSRPLVAYLRHNQSMTGGGMDVFNTEYGYLRAKFRQERERLGVELLEADTLLWVADGDARAGRRWPAVQRYFHIARRHRNTSAAKRMIAVAVWPSAMRLADRAERRRITPTWMAEAESWLQPYRTGN
jgi:glycosyltransferase involved in cell wall biosynthesis